MKIDQELMDMESFVKNANATKEIVLQRLLQDKVIDEKTAEHYSTNWQVIVIKRNWFERWMNKFMKDKNGYQFKYVKFED